MADSEPQADGMNPLGVEISSWMRRRAISSTRVLARKADISPRTIDRWMQPGFKMQREPDALVLTKLADALGVPVTLLMRRVAEARGFNVTDGLTEEQATVVALMDSLPRERQSAVVDVVTSVVEGLHGAQRSVAKLGNAADLLVPADHPDQAPATDAEMAAIEADMAARLTQSAAARRRNSGPATE